MSARLQTADKRAEEAERREGRLRHQLHSEVDVIGHKYDVQLQQFHSSVEDKLGRGVLVCVSGCSFLMC